MREMGKHDKCSKHTTMITQEPMLKHRHNYSVSMAEGRKEGAMC